MALLASTRLRLLVLLALMALLKSVAVFKATSPATDADDDGVDVQPTTAVAVTTASLRHQERSDVAAAAADGGGNHKDDAVDDAVDEAKDDDGVGQLVGRNQTASNGSNSIITVHNASTVIDYDALLNRTVVHVMEKCCPYVSRYVVGAYPSRLERDGWVPRLTFHAYRHPRVRTLPLDCWKIQETNESRSHVWRELNASDAFPLDASRAFCLPPFQRNNNASVRYVENEQRTMSFVTEPIPRQFASTSAVARPVGWRSDQPLAIKEISLLTHNDWRAMLPDRVIDRVWFHVASAPSRRQCEGGEAVDGNLNDGFATEPVVTLCVAFARVPQLKPWLDNRDQATNLTFVSELTVLTREPTAKPNGSWIDITVRKGVRHDDEQSKCDGDSVQVPWEVDSAVEWPRDDRHLRSRYDVVITTGDALVLCVRKQSLLLATGELQRPSVFVRRVEIDTTQRRRRDRLRVVYNPSVVAGDTSF